MVSNVFYFHPYLGKWSNLTNIFQMGWNHHLDYIYIYTHTRTLWLHFFKPSVWKCKFSHLHLWAEWHYRMVGIVKLKVIWEKMKESRILGGTGFIHNTSIILIYIYISIGSPEFLQDLHVKQGESPCLFLDMEPYWVNIEPYWIWWFDRTAKKEREILWCHRAWTLGRLGLHGMISFNGPWRL